MVKFEGFRLLHTVLDSLVSDEDNWGMLHPAQMALRSPKVFWNVVHAGGVGTAVSFEEALATLMPETDWKAVFTRKKKLKYDSLEWAQ